MKKVMVTLISLRDLGLGIAVPSQPMPLASTNERTKVAPQSPQRHEYRVQYHRRNLQNG